MYKHHFYITGGFSLGLTGGDIILASVYGPYPHIIAVSAIALLFILLVILLYVKKRVWDYRILLAGLAIGALFYIANGIWLFISGAHDDIIQKHWHFALASFCILSAISYAWFGDVMYKVFRNGLEE
uniref:Uncharacterized protein n=1 Tax=Acrobeloides nanus TaxID=290746 RepID=A0A914CKK9_9BILA